MAKVLITGGAGFIGSNFVKHYLKVHPDDEIINLDKLTYAGNLNNIKELEGNKNHTFIRGDICEKKVVEKAMEGCSKVIHFAAETHVDRSIIDAGTFIKTDVFGTYRLLEAARKLNVKRFIHISTDEVYGSIEEGSFNEKSPLNPRNPYSASKAGADRLAYSYFTTYGLPVTITRSSNNFGPYQYPEKLIPLFITNLLNGKRIPLYGDGLNVRDWLYVQDNCEAIEFALEKGKPGEAYNIGGGNEKPNIWITKFLLKELGKPESYIDHVQDRLGHDRRYSLDTTKIKELGWKPRFKFENALRETVRWYQDNPCWWQG
ncbi:MAG TPA: dTDP-glucose 4,6-dehydratase [Candidatus Nanoarchaeia archaeon]|nr:dTDP-glucose 4,6-dehydratase [Candidatus Nanoarchaeia archaeon]